MKSHQALHCLFLTNQGVFESLFLLTHWVNDGLPKQSMKHGLNGLI